MKKSVSSAVTARRRRGASEWRALVAAQERSGQSQEMFCKSEGISKASLSNWRRRLRSDDKPMPSKAPAPANFIEIGSTSRPLDAGLRVRLDLGAGVVLELSRL